MKTTPNPPNTTLLLRSRCVRPAASWASADFFRSATARFMPMPKFLRMRNSVNDAPTIMPPTAMGRTMWNQMAPATLAQPSSPETPGAWHRRPQQNAGQQLAHDRGLTDALHEFAERPPDHQQQDDLGDEQRLGGC